MKVKYSQGKETDTNLKFYLGPKIMDKLARYFNYIHYDASYVMPNGIYFYSNPDLLLQKIGNLIWVENTINVDLSDYQLSEKFYQPFDGSLNYGFSAGDMEIGSLTRPMDTESIGLKIVANNAIIGYYLKERNILWLTRIIEEKSGEDRYKALRKILKTLNHFARIKIVKIKYRNKDITIGCDPEFELIEKNEQNIYLTRRASWIIQGGTKEEDEIGVDGSGAPLELRPKPARTSRQLISNIKTIMKRFAEEYSDYEMGTEGADYAIGGHIHLGLKNGQLPVTPEMAKVLDNWLGKHLVSLSGTARGQYRILGTVEGFFTLAGGVRIKPWGFEYRSLPATVFHNKKILHAVLNIVRKLAIKYYSGNGVELEPTSDESYKQINCGKEWEVIKKFIREYPAMNKKIFAFWGIKTKSPEFMPYSILFRDEWDDNVKALVKKMLTEKLKHSKRTTPITIHLYGLKNSRGIDIITGIQVEGYNNIADVISRTLPIQGLRFGFARNMRYDINVNWGLITDKIANFLLGN